jgi:hypothetical protein
VNERRQRRSPPQSRAAVAAAPAATAISGAQQAVSTAQTALPAAQTTAQAFATTVATAATSSQVQYVLGILTTILGGGVKLDLEQEPPNVPPAQVITLKMRATDASGTFAALAEDGQAKTIAATLIAAAQFYPQASIQLTVLDGQNRPLMLGTREPGSPPKVINPTQ